MCNYHSVSSKDTNKTKLKLETPRISAHGWSHSGTRKKTDSEARLICIKQLRSRSFISVSKRWVEITVRREREPAHKKARKTPQAKDRVWGMEEIWCLECGQRVVPGSNKGGVARGNVLLCDPTGTIGPRLNRGSGQCEGTHITGPLCSWTKRWIELTAFSIVSNTTMTAQEGVHRIRIDNGWKILKKMQANNKTDSNDWNCFTLNRRNQLYTPTYFVVLFMASRTGTVERSTR